MYLKKFIKCGIVSTSGRQTVNGRYKGKTHHYSGVNPVLHFLSMRKRLTWHPVLELVLMTVIIQFILNLSPDHIPPDWMALHLLTL